MALFRLKPQTGNAKSRARSEMDSVENARAIAKSTRASKPVAGISATLRTSDANSDSRSQVVQTEAAEMLVDSDLRLRHHSSSSAQRSASQKSAQPEAKEPSFVFGQTPSDSGSKRQRKSARVKMMDMLARRSHSELELRQKLGKLEYPESEISAAIEDARLSGWLLPEDQIAEQVSRSLGRKRKGERFINHYLRERGLPAVKADADEELAKARDIVLSKMGRSEGPFDQKEKMKISRLLQNRGFGIDTIKKVMYEKS